MNFNITAGTIARTAVLLLALTNQLLSAMGKSPLPIESATMEQLVTAGITTIAALIAWWKNKMPSMTDCVNRTVSNLYLRRGKEKDEQYPD